MRNDKLFHLIFQHNPEAIFELIGEPPETAERYEAYRSEEIKEKGYRLDGVLIPKQANTPLCFVEVQVERDEWFFHRLFSEVFLYLHQKRCKGTWRAVVIFWDRASEPVREDFVQAMFDMGNVQVVYLKPFLKAAPRNLVMNLLRLMVATKRTTKPIIHEIKQQIEPQKELQHDFFVEIVVSILLSKFSNLTRDEAMKLLDLGIDLSHTRFYQEMEEEFVAKGRQEGELKGRQEGEAIGIAKGIVKLLEDRFGNISDQMRERLFTTDSATLLSYYEKVWHLTKPEDLFA